MGLLSAHLRACLTLQPERADQDRIHAAAVAPLPGAPKADTKAEAAALRKKQRGAGLLDEAGGIKAAPGGTLFAALGGSDAVTAIIEVALGKVQADWRVKRFLEGGDSKQMEAWLAAAFGGPAYVGADPAELYTSLAAAKGLNASHLDVLEVHLVGAMQELGMPEECVEAAAAVVADQRRLWCAPLSTSQ